MRWFASLALVACAGTPQEDSESSGFGDSTGAQELGGSESGSSEGSTDGSSGGGSNTDQLWNQAVSDHQFTYYYNASDYSEKYVYHFCANGTGSYFWIINSGGITGTGSQNGGDEGTWEIVETNEQAANIRVVGQTDGEGWILMTVDADGRFYIDETRYYREHSPC